MSDCVFCQIIDGSLKTKKEFENDRVVVFWDIKPSAETHLLIVPKRHITNLMEIKKEDGELIIEMFKAAQKMVKKHKLEKGYKIVFNGGKYQFVHHLHMHLLGGKMKGTV